MSQDSKASSAIPVKWVQYFKGSTGFVKLIDTDGTVWEDTSNFLKLAYTMSYNNLVVTSFECSI